MIGLGIFIEADVDWTTFKMLPRHRPAGRCSHERVS
jgi:hypothetical protein